MLEQAVFMEFSEGGSTVFNREGERTPPKPRFGPDGKPAVTGFSKEFRNMYALSLNSSCLLLPLTNVLMHENVPYNTKLPQGCDWV